MNDISTEQKLQLVQQIRSQYHKNQYDISNRERILYGRTSGNPNASNTTTAYQREVVYATDDTGENTASESLKLRSILAAMLFIFAILFDLFGVKPGGMEMQQLFEVIEEDYKDNVIEMVEAISSESVLQSIQ